MNISKDFYKEFNHFIPGFSMGFIRSIISHPFEMLKLKTQMNIKENIFKNLFKGIHLSILTNSFERGIQFYYFKQFNEKLNNILLSSLYSSLISTTISLPYNIILLKKNILNKSIYISKNTLFKSSALEYSRNLSGSSIFLYSYNNFKNLNYPIYAASIMSTSIVWIITYPIDNIKNQYIAGNINSIKYINLYNGIQYPLIRSIPSSTIGFYVYEYLDNYLNK
jgi:hypothetical protein